MISFVIPAKNEEKHLGVVLRSIRATLEPLGLEHEVVVVDHGSRDRTVAVATEGGARVLVAPEAPTIGSMRNRGVLETQGELIVFLDADVSLAPDWGELMADGLAAFRSDPKRVSGSEVLAPPNGTALERIWFGVPGRDRSHLNSGHFLIGRKFYDELGGFSEVLRTGEDHDLTVRAAAAGGTIDPDPRLRVFHHGFPATVREFFRREVWHGISTFDSLKQIRTSRVSLITVGLLTLIVLSGLLAALSGRWIALALPVAAWLGVSLASAAVRRKRSWLDLPILWFYYAVYFVARCFSPIARLRQDSHWKR